MNLNAWLFWCVLTVLLPEGCGENFNIGNEELAAAVNAGLMRLVASGKYAREYTRPQPSNQAVYIDCVPSPEKYPFPTVITPSGTFERVLRTGYLQVAQVKQLPASPLNRKTSLVDWPYMNSTAVPATGFIPSMLDDILVEISNFYNVTVRSNYTKVSTSRYLRLRWRSHVEASPFRRLRTGRWTLVADSFRRGHLGASWLPL